MMTTNMMIEEIDYPVKMASYTFIQRPNINGWVVSLATKEAYDCFLIQKFQAFPDILNHIAAKFVYNYSSN